VIKPKNVEDAVRYILAHYPEARNNDMLLTILYWDIFNGIKLPKPIRLALLHQAEHFETIRRTRQRIQAVGDYRPRKEMQKYRRSRSRKFRKALKAGQQTLTL